MHSRPRLFIWFTRPAAPLRMVVALLTLMAFVFAATTPNLAVTAVGLDGRLCSLQPHNTAPPSSSPVDAGIPLVFDQCCVICVVAHNLAGGLSHQHFTLPIIGDATGIVAVYAAPDRPLDRFTGFSRRARAPPIMTV